MSALLNVKQFVRFDEHGNLHVPNKLFVACQAYVQTPLINDTSSRVATTEWVRAQISGLTGISLSETDPIWIFEKALYYTKVQADARYLQSFTETDPTVSAWAKASVKPTYTFAELLSKPTTIAGYGITDIPTTLPASDVYAWAKAATKPSYAYSEITGLPALFSGVYADLTGKPTLFSGSYTDLTNKPTIPTYTLSGLGGQPLDADLTAIAALAGTAGFLKKTAADTWALDNNTYLTSYTETDPIWTAEKTNYALKTYVDTSISNLVASAPAALDTLNELALALGSDASFSTTVATSIGNRVPYTGATTNVDLGVNDFTSRYVNSQFAFIQGNGTMGGVLGFTQYATSYTTTTNNTNIYALGNNKINFSFYQIGGAFKIFNFDVSSLDTTNTRAYTLPNASGTVALTSDIPSLANYVTLDGTQTISGAKTFTSTTLFNSATINLATIPSGGIAEVQGNLFVSNGISFNETSSPAIFANALGFSVQRSGITSTINVRRDNVSGSNYTQTLSFSNNAANRIYTFPDANGTIALTSNLSSYVPTTRTITINGTALDLSADRAWTITTASTYTLPIASAIALGGIKVGTNLSIDANGVLSSTDTNTTYVNFTRTVAGLVPNPGGATTNRYLREDGTWVIPPDTDTDTVYVHPTTAGNKHIPAGGAAGQILRWSADGAATWGADVDTDTTYSVFTGATASANGTAGLVIAPLVANRAQYLKGDGTWGTPPDTIVTSLAWTSITSRPTALSQFTNDLGNYGSFLTAESDTLATVTARGSSTAQNITFSNGRKGLVGVYDAGQTQAIFAMGAAYVLTDGGASNTIGSLYGLAWSYNPDYGAVGNNPQSKAGLNHQLLLMQNGVTTAAMGSGIWTSGNVTGSSFIGTTYWTSVSGRPTALSGLTNDLGNYGGWYSASGGTISGNVTINGTTNAPLTLRAVEPYMDVVATGASNTAGVALYPTAGYEAAIGNFNGGSLNLVAAGYTIAKVTRSSGVIFYVGTTGPIQALGNNTSAYHTFVNSASDNKSWDISLYGNDWILNESNVLPRLKVLAGGGVYADSFFEFSDKRFKQVVKDNPDFVGIESITAKHYIKEGKEEIGYFAQDFEGVLDSAILKDKDDVLSLSYRQVHTAKIAALEKRIAELEAKLK